MTLVGLMPAPKGETADFYGTSDLQVTILVVYITTSVLATVGLILRLYTGARLIRKLGLDACKFLSASEPSDYGMVGFEILTHLVYISLPRRSMGCLPVIVHWYGQGDAMWLWQTSLERHGGRLAML